MHRYQKHTAGGGPWTILLAEEKIWSGTGGRGILVTLQMSDNQSLCDPETGFFFMDPSGTIKKSVEGTVRNSVH